MLKTVDGSVQTGVAAIALGVMAITAIIAAVRERRSSQNSFGGGVNTERIAATGNLV